MSNYDHCEIDISDSLIYHGFEIEEMPRIGEVPGYVRLIYDFEVPGGKSITPTFVIPSEEEDVGSENTFLNLAFHLGLAELIRYAKPYRIKTIVIEPFGLSKEQIKWWEEYYNCYMTQVSKNTKNTDNTGELDNLKADDSVQKIKVVASDEDILPCAGFSVEVQKNKKWQVLLKNVFQISHIDLNIDNDNTGLKESNKDIEKEFPWMAESEKDYKVEILHIQDEALIEAHIDEEYFLSLAFAATIWAYIREESIFTIKTSKEFLSSGDIDAFNQFIQYEKIYIGSGTEIERQ